MNRRQFLASSFAASAAAQSFGKGKGPNIIVVMMDDFGIGHFAPHSEHLSIGQNDPALMEHIREREQPYSAEESLAVFAARDADDDRAGSEGRGLYKRVRDQ